MAMWVGVLGVICGATPCISAAIELHQPVAETPLGFARGASVSRGVERFGGIPYALPPTGARRFAQAEVDNRPWENGTLDATSLGPPCLQNPPGDPRSSETDSAAPTEDCLKLNIWRPANATTQKTGTPVLVFLFGGGLCSGFAASKYFDGSKFVQQHGVLIVTVQYRLGALGFIVGADESRPGNGGMNGIYDTIAALKWLKHYIHYFGGDADRTTLMGHSSGGYSVCTLCVAPEANGLFTRAVLLSGPCFGGPPGRGWGPSSAEMGANITHQIFTATETSSLDELRELPGYKISWPDEWMSDLDKAPYFSGYFEDPALVPTPIEALWRNGSINVKELLVSFTSKDGTAAFYGTAPTLGYIKPDINSSTPAGYAQKMKSAWKRNTDTIMRQYPMDQYWTAPAAFAQADADANVICPSRRLARYSAGAGVRTWVMEFAHFQPSHTWPAGCSGHEPAGCQGMGCDNGVELDVVPGAHDATTRLWASHGSEYHFLFGTEVGPDGVGPPNNVTFCDFNADEAQLSRSLMAHIASFAKHGNPNKGAIPGSPHWPMLISDASGSPIVERMRFSVEATDGAPTKLIGGIRDQACDFWDSLFPPEASSDAGEILN